MESKTSELKEQFLKIYWAETSSDDVFNWISNTLESYSAQYREENERLKIQASNYAYQMDLAKRERDTAERRLAELEAEIAALRGHKSCSLSCSPGDWFGKCVTNGCNTEKKETTG